MINESVRGIYRHYKGKYYEVVDIGRHSENLEEFIIYRCLYGDFSFFIRPKDMFFEEVIYNGKNVQRFELVQKLEEIVPHEFDINKLTT